MRPRSAAAALAAALALGGCEPQEEAPPPPAPASRGAPRPAPHAEPVGVGDAPSSTAPRRQEAQPFMETAKPRVQKTPEEWRKLLTPEQYHVLREKGTERAFTGKLHDNHVEGVYRCAGCGAVLFRSSEKFDSGTGWPSFWAPASKEAVAVEDDSSLFMRRTEVHCAACGGHLGHVFDDGPKPTGKRYCINSASLDFKPDSPK